jgi:twitching motility protein PilT
MRRLQALVSQLQRSDARKVVLSAGEPPRLSIDTGECALGDACIEEAALLELLFAAGGSRHLDDVSEPAAWSIRIPPVGLVRIAVCQVGGKLRAELTRDDLERSSSQVATDEIRRAREAVKVEAAPAPPPLPPRVEHAPAPPPPPHEEQFSRAPQAPRAPAPTAERRPSRRAMEAVKRRPSAANIAAAGKRLEALAKLVAQARELGATDVHLVPGKPILHRVRGKLTGRGDALDAAAIAAIAPVPERLAATLDAEGACTFTIELGASRCRVHAVRGDAGLGLVVRPLGHEARPFAGLAIPDGTRAALERRLGLFVIASARGQGRTSTLASAVDHLAQLEPPLHIVVLEKPAEIPLVARRAIVSAREVGTHVTSYSVGVREALRHDVDVIVLGDLDDAGAIEAAHEAARAGVFVVGALLAPSVTTAAERLERALSAREVERLRPFVLAQRATSDGMVFEALDPDGGVRVERPSSSTNVAAAPLAVEAPRADVTAHVAPPVESEQDTRGGLFGLFRRKDR